MADAYVLGEMANISVLAKEVARNNIFLNKMLDFIKTIYVNRSNNK